MTTEQIRELINEAQQMLAARAVIEDAAQTVHNAIQAYATATGGTVLQAWRALAPEGVDIPDDPEPEPVPDPDDYPAWVQPQAHNPYMKGDRVSFEGQVWESVQDVNVWSPLAYPQGWRLVT